MKLRIRRMLFLSFIISFTADNYGVARNLGLLNNLLRNGQIPDVNQIVNSEVCNQIESTLKNIESFFSAHGKKMAFAVALLVLVPLFQFIWWIVEPIFRPIFEYLGNLFKKKIGECSIMVYLYRHYWFKMFTYQEMAQISAAIDSKMDNVIGHDEQKKTLKKMLLSSFITKYENYKFGLKNNAAKIIEIYGTPGIGKSEIIINVCKALLKEKQPYLVTAAMIDQKNERTVLDQLFYNVDDFGKKHYSNLYYYIKFVPYGIVVLDEFDKFWQMDPDGLTEFFRGILDHGFIIVGDEKLDCKNITFLVSFNRYGNTGIVHDESYLTRINLIQFDPLTCQDIFKITKRNLMLIAEDVNDKYCCTLVYDDDMISKIAKDVYTQGKGCYRPANFLLDWLKSAIELLWITNAHKPLNKILYLSYDNYNDGIIVSEKSSTVISTDKKIIGETLPEKKKRINKRINSNNDLRFKNKDKRR